MKLDPLKINSRFRCKNTYKELNSLIKSTAELVEKRDNNYSSESSQFEDHIDLLYSHLFEKTNLEHKFKHLKDSKASINIFEVLYKLQKFNENILTDKLLELLSEELDKINKKPIVKHKVILLSNIQKIIKFNENKPSSTEIKELEIYSDILELFGMKRVKLQDFIDSHEKSNKNLEKIKKFFDIFSSITAEIIEIPAEGRNLQFSLNSVISELELLFGFLSFIRCSFRGGYTWRYDGDYSIDKLDYISLFVLDENGEIVNPSTDYRIRLNIRDWENSRLVDLDIRKDPDKFRMHYNFAREDKTDGNKSKMWNNLKEFLCLYHNACSEESMDYSFLGFWMVSEKVLKKINGKTKDDELLRTIEKILKMFYKWPVENFIEKRIKFLYNKRNRLVHEGDFHIISQGDRNLSKLIADCVLMFYIDNFPSLNNMNEYKFILQNIRRPVNEIERYSELLKSISENKKV